ncbi:MAG: O-antigen ligase family protein [Terrimicrobiaceae bacterium]
MNYAAAVLCALGILLAQYFYGGLFRQVFAIPGLVAVGVAGLFAGSLIFQRNRPAPRVLALGLTLALAGWLLWRIASAAPTLETESLFQLVLACLVAYLVFATTATSAKTRLTFFGVLFIAAMIQATLGGYQFINKIPTMPFPWASEILRHYYDDRLGSRAHGFFINGNHLAWFLNVAGLAALSAACWARWSAWGRILALYVAAVCFAGCLPTLSRGGFIGLASGLSVFLLLSGYALAFGAGGRRIAALLTLVAGAIIACGSAWFVFTESSTVQARLALLTQDTYRPQIFQSARRLFETSPILGAGAGSFKEAARTYRETPTPADDIFAHNDWLQVSAEFGFPALVLLLLLVVVHFANGLRGLSRQLKQHMAVSVGAASNGAAVQMAALSALTACVVHSFFDFNMQIPANALLAATCAGMLANAGAHEDSPHRLRAVYLCVVGLVAVAASLWLLVLVAGSSPAQRQHLAIENAYHTRRYDSAIELADEALSQAPNNFDIRLLRARSYLDRSLTRRDPALKIQDTSAARADYEAAAQLRPLDVYHQIGLARALGRLGAFAESGEAASDAIARHPLGFGGYQVLGQIAQAGGRDAEALRFYAISSTLPMSQTSREFLRALQKRQQEQK